MSDSQFPSTTLVDILRVLERIERRLNEHDDRLSVLNGPLAGGSVIPNYTGANEEQEDIPEHSSVSRIAGGELNFNTIKHRSAQNDSNSELSGEIPSCRHSVGQPSETPKIPYSHWSFDQEDQDADEGLNVIFQTYSGDYWKIPRDNRLPLKPIKAFKHNTGGYWESQPVIRNVSVSNYEKNLASFSQFDTVLKSHKGNDFLVIDYDPANNTRIYRLGEKAIGDELMVLPEEREDAPWSRLM